MHKRGHGSSGQQRCVLSASQEEVLVADTGLPGARPSAALRFQYSFAFKVL